MPLATACLAVALGLAQPTQGYAPRLPDQAITEAYEMAATRNVLACRNPRVFPGYFCVCADGQGFGYGNSYPSLDGHQITDALVWLGDVGTAKLNFDFVRGFMRPDGQLPLAILPGAAGQVIGGSVPEQQSRVDPNGGLYRHWVPGDPLRALASPTYIQNADVIYRRTFDRVWLKRELPSVNRSADFLASLMDRDGSVRGAGYYVERPARIEYDGVTQCHAYDAFLRVAALNAVVGRPTEARRYRALAVRVRDRFRARFWVKDHFAEYIHPQRGVVANHGLTDVDWSAIATGIATPAQVAVLWPQLRRDPGFDYGGMPAGVVTRPDAYEDWEFTVNDRHDMAAMGRVWYLASWAMARMGDGDGLAAALGKVAAAGKRTGYDWQERYGPQGGYGPNTYCEYPANLIRIVQRFLMGVEFGLDGVLTLAPVVPAAYWKSGFGQLIEWRGRRLDYRLDADGMRGTFTGPGALELRVRFPGSTRSAVARAGGKPIRCHVQGGLIYLALPASAAPVRVEVMRR